MKPTFVTIIFALLAFSGRSARAEYRAFQLQITNTKTGATRLVTSTLDAIQYPDYYPLRQYETVLMLDTWMCWGRTGDFKRICPNPHPDGAASRASDRSPSAAQTRPTASSAPKASARP